MTLSIYNLSLKIAIAKIVPRIAIFHLKQESSPRGCFAVYGSLLEAIWQ